MSVGQLQGVVDTTEQGRAARWWRLYRADMLAVAVLLAAAFAARWPYLFLIPQWTDEMLDIRWAWDIVQGKSLPLVSGDYLNGPIFHYLLAALIFLFGPSFNLARLLVMVLGVGTVALTYALGRAVGGRLTGLVAATLMVTAPNHILVNSHLAWSNSATPFFTTLAILVLTVAERRSSGPLLALGGLLVGLACQTHLSVIPLVVGLFLAFLLRRGLLSWLRSPWPYVALALAFLGYANVILYNLGGNTPWSIRSIISAAASADYTRVYQLTHELETSEETSDEPEPPAEELYLDNLQKHTLELIHVLAGTLRGKQQLTFTYSPLIPLYAAWLLAGLVYAAFRGWRIPLLVVVSCMLIMPNFNYKFSSHTILPSRYIAFLVPVCYVAMAWLLDRLSQAVSSRLPSQTRPAPSGQESRAVVVLLAVLLLALQPLQPLQEYYQGKVEGGRTNTPISAIVERTHTLRSGYPLVYLGEGLGGYSLGGGGTLLLTLDTALLLEGAKYESCTVEEIKQKLTEEKPGGKVLLALTNAEYEKLSGTYPLQLLESYDLPARDGFSFGFYGFGG